MKKIFLFWCTFFVFFFGAVLIGFFARISENIVVVSLFLLFFVFQGIAFWKGAKTNIHWITSSLIVQMLFAVAAPLYYSIFGDPVYEFVTGEWFQTNNAFEPCQLCWWARILMFPLLPLSIFYAISRSRPLLWYMYGASIIGVLLESFHYLLQKTSIPNPFGCTLANPCSELGVQYLGFITIPLLGLMAFLGIHMFVSFLLFFQKPGEK